MYDSQKTRRVLDRLVDYKISPILWNKVQRGISAGQFSPLLELFLIEKLKLKSLFLNNGLQSMVSRQRWKPFEVGYYGEEKTKKNELKDEKKFRKSLIIVREKTLK